MYSAVYEGSPSSSSSSTSSASSSSVKQVQNDAEAKQQVQLQHYVPLPVERYLSTIGASRVPSALRALVPFMQLKGMISLGGGMPSPSLFPFEKVQVTFKDGHSFSFSASEAQQNPSSASASMISEAFQYSGTPGIDSLLRELRALQIREHHPVLSEKDWSVAVCVGSQDALAKMFEVLVGAGDNLLLESPTYSGALSIVRPLGCHLHGIECDQEGLIPSHLNSILENWDTQTQGRRPHVLYLIPTGQNPAGTSLPLHRRKEIFSICCKYDVLIMEDDPYFFLAFDTERVPTEEEDDDSFVRPYIPSFFSMDTEGRVLRFDSLSKVVSSGLRLGFATGPKQFIDKMLLITQSSNLHPSGISQLMAAQFMSHLGEKGWRKHVDHVSLHYARRRDILCDLVDKYLHGLVEYTRPRGGMFLWLKLIGIPDSQKLIEDRARKNLVLLVPGTHFMPNHEISNYVRASFSLATVEDMEIAMQRFALCIREELAEIHAASLKAEEKEESKAL